VSVDVFAVLAGVDYVLFNEELAAIYHMADKYTQHIYTRITRNLISNDGDHQFTW